MPVYAEPPLVATNDIVASTIHNGGIRQPIMRLREMLPDPSASGQVLRSNGAGSLATADWVAGVDAVLDALGYTPVNKAVDSGVGTLAFGSGKAIVFAQENGTKVLLTANGGYAIGVAANTVEITTDRDVGIRDDAAGAGVYAFLFNTATGLFTGVAATLSGALTAASAVISGALSAASATFSGALSAASAAISGNATVGGTLGVTGTTTAAAISATSLTASGTVQGNVLASSVAPGTAPISVSSATKVPSLNVDKVDGADASATPTANTIPIADASGKLDAWVTAPAGFPTGYGGWVRQASEIPSGHARETNLDGRIPVGAGTTFSVTYVEATNYGASWSHGHSITGSISVTGPSGTNSAQTATGGGTHGDATDSHTHGLSGGYGVSTDAWTIPSRAVVWIRKT